MFLFDEWTATQIKAKLVEVHGYFTLVLKTIHFLINIFKYGHTYTDSKTFSMYPAEVTTKDTIEQNLWYCNGRQSRESVQITKAVVSQLNECTIYCMKNCI